MASKIPEDMWRIALARIRTMPPSWKLVIGEGDRELVLTQDDMVRRLQAKDEYGREIAEMQLEYLQGLRELAAKTEAATIS